VEAAHSVAARAAVHGAVERVFFVDALGITARPLALRGDAQVEAEARLAGLLEGAVIAVVARGPFVVGRVEATPLVAKVLGANGAVVALHCLTLHAALGWIAGFYSAAKVTVVAQCVVRHMEDSGQLLAATVRGAVKAVINHGRYAVHAALLQIALLGTVAEEAVVAHAMIGHVLALVVIQAGILGAVYSVVTEDLSVDNALSFLTIAGLLALALRNLARCAVSLLFENAAALLVAGIAGTGVVVIADLRGPRALQCAGDVIVFYAVVVLGAKVPVITSDPGFLPLIHAGIGALLGLVVAPRGLAGVLGHALVGSTGYAFPSIAAGIVVRTGIAVEAGMALGMELHAVAGPVRGVADEVHAIIRVAVFTLHRVPTLADPGLALVTVGAEAAVFAGRTVGQVGEHAACFGVAGVFGAAVGVVAYYRGAGADSVGAGVPVRTRIAVITGIADDGRVEASPVGQARVLGAIVVVVTVCCRAARSGDFGSAVEGQDLGIGHILVDGHAAAAACGKRWKGHENESEKTTSGHR